MSVSYPTKLLLAFRSGGRCALPDCTTELTHEYQSPDSTPVLIGEAAHIAGEHGGTKSRKPAARYIQDMTDEDRNHYKNLIYLCPSCHTKIDAIPQGELAYPIQRLLQIKYDHEKKVRQAMLDGFADVGFPELQEATAWVRRINTPPVQYEYDAIFIGDKIRKNGLEQESWAIVLAGLSVASEVKRYIQMVSQDDPDFPDRLKTGFLSEFFRLRKEDVSGMALFEGMCGFSQRGLKTPAERSAGLAVLVYLFEACEIFEK